MNSVFRINNEAAMNNHNDTKQKLIIVTKQMIDDGNIESVSLREIGKKAQLSRSAVYRHFKSKEDMFSAIVLENFKTLHTDLFNIISETADPVDVLVSLMRHYYHFGISNPEHYNLMFCNRFDKEQYPKVHMAALETFEAVLGCIINAQMQNRIVDKPTKELAALAYSFIHGLVLLNSSGHKEQEKGLDDPHKLIDSFINMIKM
jgi:AcrR family transcriptional regulator